MCKSETSAVYRKHGAATTLGGFGGMPPQENFENLNVKWCILEHFRADPRPICSTKFLGLSDDIHFEK